MQITSENLDATIEMNARIAKDIEEHIAFIEKRLIKWRSLPIEEQAFEILKEYQLIEIPIPDNNWGGAIRKFSNGTNIPIINTAQPRVYQYFIYWHEIFHLTENEELKQHGNDYEITVEFDLNERKADFFASKMIFGHADLYDYFHSLSYDHFLAKIAHCMKSFKAPYKAVLIQLYQLAKKNLNEHLQSEIKVNFDKHWLNQEWSNLFQEYSLDDSFIRPSFVINLNAVKRVIREEIHRHPDVDLYQDNLHVVESWEEKFRKIQKDLKGRFDGEL